MKSKFLWTLLAIFAFLFFLVLYMPAKHLLQSQSLPKGVNLYGISGTVWEGKAQAVVVNGIPVTNVEWEISGLSLLIGRIHADVHGGNLRDANEVSFKGEITTSLFSPQQVNSDEFLLFLPVDRVLAEVQLPVPVNAGGRFRVRIEQLSFGPNCNELIGFGDWLNATVAGTQGPIDFGNYSATLRCENRGIGITVKEPNKLGLSLDAVLEAGFNGFSISGKFKPDPSLPEEVHQAGAIFGRPGPDGYIEFSL
ncbi:type II secretion system protein N [Aestuariibacter sp. A3R04]|uniref:type II secretion system protein N n=1 Tax=Aestuariibacter sp. A3R04 TaxID=2841571 RepID=UPI001C095C25|nr:type II secretion system protein N [Aestuariibacter sp. A3R04]MBU3020352.1 type II secretion system protein N [Aestuariibacter sp. A3R04]